MTCKVDVFPSILPSSLFCFHCLFLLLALCTHRQLPSTPLSCAQEFMRMNTQTQKLSLTHTHTHTHTLISHPVLTQSLPAAIVTELTVLLSVCAATVTAAARGGCVREGVLTNVRSPLSHHKLTERGRALESLEFGVHLFIWIHGCSK